MSMNFHEHHFRNLGRARDHLTETIVSLRSAVDRMTGDDWIDATTLLRGDHGRHRPAARAAAHGRVGALRRAHPAQRLRGHAHRPAAVPRRAPAGRRRRQPPIPPRAATRTPPRLEAPNAKRGAELVAKHGGVDAAMMAYEPDSPEFDDIQAYRYVSTGKRPQGWIPPIV